MEGERGGQAAAKRGDVGGDRPGFGVSVVIPCFNSEATIAECLGSVLDQGVDDLEVIVVDDGSEDETRDALRRFEPRIRYVYQPNRGVSCARNVGARLAAKEWIAFCDADDVWFPNKLSICAEVVRRSEDCELLFHDYSVMHGDRVLAERGTHSDHSFFPMLKRHALTLPQMLPGYSRYALELPPAGTVCVDTYRGSGLPWMILGNFILPSSVVMKRRLFLEHGGFDEGFAVAEDTELFLRLAKATGFLYIDLPLHGYRRSPDSLMARNLEGTLLFGIRGIEKNCLGDRELMGRYGPYVRASLARRKADLAYFYLSELATGKALGSAVGALQLDRASALAWKVLFLSLLPRRLLRWAGAFKREQKSRRRARRR